MRQAKSNVSRRSDGRVERDQGREFERLYRESYGFVYNFVRSRIPDDAAAEDIVAESFLRAARAFSRFDPARAKFSTWVIKIAINNMNSYWHKTRPTMALENIPEGFAAQQGPLDDLAECDFVDRLLAVLDATERNLVVMKYREGYRNIDIARETGMNPSTVATRLANALAKMRAFAEKNGALDGGRPAF